MTTNTTYVREDSSRGYPIALVSALVLSTTAILIRHLTETYQIPALVLAFWRDGFAVLGLLPVLSFRKAMSLPDYSVSNVLFLVGFGSVLAGFNALWTLSVALNGAAIATMLVYSSVVFTTLLEWRFFRERMDWANWVAVVFSLVGCAIVAGAFDPTAWRINPVAILTGLLSGLGYAAYSLMGRGASKRGISPWTTLFYTFLFATVFLFFINLFARGRLPGTPNDISGIFWLGKAMRGWGVLILLALGPTVAGFGFYNVSLTYLPSSIVNLIATLEPVFTTMLAHTLLGEKMTALQLVGGFLTLIGIVVLRIRDLDRPRSMH